MKFHVNDLDLDQLEKDIILESNKIWDPDGERTYENVYEMVSIGKPAENFLKEKAKFTEDTRPYHDLISVCGESVEVKVRNIKNVDETLIKLSALRSDPRRYLKSDWVFIFTMEGRDVYELHGTYHWNSELGEYMKEKFNWKAEWEQWESLNSDKIFLDNLK